MSYLIRLEKIIEFDQSSLIDLFNENKKIEINKLTISNYRSNSSTSSFIESFVKDVKEDKKKSEIEDLNENIYKENSFAEIKEEFIFNSDIEDVDFDAI